MAFSKLWQCHMPPSIPPECVEVVRCALAPRMILKNHNPKIISPAQAVARWQPYDFGDGVSVLTLSAGRCDKLDTIEAVHDFGCRVARAMNARLQEQRGRPLKRPKESAHYIGSYWIRVADVHNIESDVFEIEILETPSIEDNLDEHCDIVLRPRRAAADGHEEDAELTEVIAQLQLCLRNPQSFRCCDDIDVQEYLANISLISDSPPMMVAG